MPKTLFCSGLMDTRILSLTKLAITTEPTRAGGVNDFLSGAASVSFSKPIVICQHLGLSVYLRDADEIIRWRPLSDYFFYFALLTVNVPATLSQFREWRTPHL
jgi:hypothetical protein